MVDPYTLKLDNKSDGILIYESSDYMSGSVKHLKFRLGLEIKKPGLYIEEEKFYLVVRLGMVSREQIYGVFTYREKFEKSLLYKLMSGFKLPIIKDERVMKFY